MSGAVTRRSALVGASVAVVGAIAGFVYGRNSDATEAAKPGGGGYGGGSSGGGSSSGAAQPLTTLAKVPVGGGWIGGGVVVTRDASGVHAFSSSCTHLGCTVNQVSNGKIFCPCHGSEFDAKTGAVVQGPATAPLPAVPVTVRSGEVYPK